MINGKVYNTDYTYKHIHKHVNMLHVVHILQECKAVDVYRDISTIFGMAFYNHRLVNIPFPSALFKKLLGEKPTLRDLEELSPCQARYVFNFSIIITNYNTNYNYQL